MSVAKSRPKKMTKSVLKKMYKNSNIHSLFCECSSCLFSYYKWRYPKSRIRIETFLFVWLAFFLSKIKKDRKEGALSFKDLKINWPKILSLYYQITCKEEYAQLNEHYRIIWRLRKKINIPMIILKREQDIESLPFCDQIGIEAKKSIRKYNSKFDLDLFLLYTSKIVKFLTQEKIGFFKRKKGIKHRDIQRRFKKIRKEDLFAILDFLEQTKLNIIKWDKENRRVFINPDYEKNSRWFSFHLYSLYEYSTNFRKIYPESEKKIFFKHSRDFQFYYYPSILNKGV